MESQVLEILAASISVFAAFMTIRNIWIIKSIDKLKEEGYEIFRINHNNMLFKFWCWDRYKFIKGEGK